MYCANARGGAGSEQREQWPSKQKVVKEKDGMRWVNRREGVGLRENRGRGKEGWGWVNRERVHKWVGGGRGKEEWNGWTESACTREDGSERLGKAEARREGTGEQRTCMGKKGRGKERKERRGGKCEWCT